LREFPDFLASFGFRLPLSPPVVEPEGRRNQENLGDLVARAACRDDGSWRQLHDLVRPYLITLVRRWLPNRLRSRLDPEDVVQEALERMDASLGHLAYRDPQSFRAWMRKVTIRTVLDEVKHHERRRRSILAEAAVGEGIASPLALDTFRELESRIDIHEGLRHLTKAERGVLRLRYVDVCSWRGVAQALEQPATNCRKLETRALERLARFFVTPPTIRDPDHRRDN